MSGGSSGNPGDKPYVVKTINDDDNLATAELQAARDAGFEVIAAAGNPPNRWVILANYHGKS